MTAYSLGLADLFEWKGDRGDLALLTVTHDFDEVITGDINTPTKKNSGYDGKWAKYKAGQLKTPWFIDHPYGLSDAPVIVKLADLFDAYFFLDEEHKMGNREVEHVLQDIYDRVLRAIDVDVAKAFGEDSARKARGLFMTMCADRGRTDALVS